MVSPGFNPLQTCSWSCLPYTDVFGVSLSQPTGILRAAPRVLGLSAVTASRDANTHCWELEVGSGAIPEGHIRGET